jgi:hypothetical protein
MRAPHWHLREFMRTRSKARAHEHEDTFLRVKDAHLMDPSLTNPKYLIFMTLTLCLILTSDDENGSAALPKAFSLPKVQQEMQSTVRFDHLWQTDHTTGVIVQRSPRFEAGAWPTLAHLGRTGGLGWRAQAILAGRLGENTP